MTRDEYQKQAVRTASGAHRNPKLTRDMMHAAVGIATEAGELLDAIKKSAFYGSEIDYINLAEELGDLEWYMALMREELGITQRAVQKRNIAKLRARYPEGFTQEDAEDRDTDAERKVLEEVDLARATARLLRSIYKKGAHLLKDDAFMYDVERAEDALGAVQR